MLSGLIAIMRQIVFNPAVLLLLVPIGVIALLTLCRFANRRQNQLYLRQITIFLFLFTGLNVSIPPFVFLYPEALAGFDKTLSSAIAQLAVYGFFALTLMSWFSDFFNSGLLLFRNPFLGLLLVLAIVSPLWSDTPDLAWRLGVVLFFTSLLSAHMVKDLSWARLAKLLRWVTLAATLACIALARLAPAIAFNDKGLSGILPFPIRLGTCMALGIALWFSLLLDQRKDQFKVVVVILLMFGTLVMTNSGQAIITCVALMSLVVLIRVLKKTGRFAPIIVLLYVFISILLLVTSNTLISKTFDALGKDATLSGRTEFWPQLIERLLTQRPFLGWGVNGFWQPWRGSLNPANGILNSSGFAPPTAHNGFLDLALCLGLVGILLFGISFLAGFIQAVRHFGQGKSSGEVLPLLLLVYVAMANISETQLLGSNYIWILYVMTLVRLNIKSTQVISERSTESEISSLSIDYPSFSSNNVR